MNKTHTNISIDPTLKKKAVKLFAELGLDLSSAITLFLVQAVREQAIPFEIKLDNFNKDTIEAINEIKYMKDKKKYKRYNSFDEILKELK